ncbi:transporter [Mesorhizobium sp. L-8-10]|uniref:TRAP transporter large permease n=1 Tax=Mesorhizobium sp. L-8-10 TaxID=2744523 RepID=UPI001925DB2A|nr:TRAP transporter large permease [Mesorhizobium sp. L-8-10]BCH29062.1 transporter [Mesorhizobium sp. L-8-10]
MAWLLITLYAAATLAGGVAIAYVTGAVAVLSFVAADEARHLAILPQRVLSQLDVFTFLAMPLFILAGELMSRGGITRALIDLAVLIVGRFRGGLGHVNVATAIFLSSMSGSAVADAAAITSALVPEMERRGYKREYSAALTVASSVLGPLIPPSIVMIFYGALMNVSVAALFAGGVLPGLLLAGGLFAYNAWAARRHNHPGGRDVDMPPVAQTLIRSTPALLVPSILLAGIIFGVVTPTEAAALAVAAALAISFVYSWMEPGSTPASALKSLGGHLGGALERAATLTGAIFVILFSAAVFGYLIAIEGVPDAVLRLVESAGLSGLEYLLLIALVFLVVGMVMDNTMALVLLVPLLIPAAIAGGADPVHVGVVTCLNLTIGLISPPVGGSLMVVSAMSGVPYLRLARAIIPFFVLEIIVLVLLVVFPEITLYIPRQAGLLH